MGEYATRKRDGQTVKIGTCESMYYCRYEQFKGVDYEGDTSDLFWRIPTPEEDGIEVGDFDYELFRQDALIPNMLSVNAGKFSKETISNMRENVMTLQLRDERMGLMVNVKCPHGLPLKDENFGSVLRRKDDDFLISYGYNGHKDVLYLAALKNTEKDLRVCVQCRCCRAMWSFSFPEIEPMVVNLWMKLRLLHQCSDYWYQHNNEPFNAEVSAFDGQGKKLSISALDYNHWQVEINGESICNGSWVECRNAFIHALPSATDIQRIDKSKIRPADYEEMLRDAEWGYKMLKHYNLGRVSELLQDEVNKLITQLEAQK